MICFMEGAREFSAQALKPGRSESAAVETAAKGEYRKNGRGIARQVRGWEMAPYP